MAVPEELNLTIPDSEDVLEQQRVLIENFTLLLVILQDVITRIETLETYHP